MNESDTANFDKNGRLRHELVVCGCRANVTNEEIASELNVSIATVERAVSALKMAEIVINWGYGWIEIDASLVWCGDEAIRQAYNPVQMANKNHPTLIKITFD